MTNCVFCDRIAVKGDDLCEAHLREVRETRTRAAILANASIGQAKVIKDMERSGHIVFMDA